jgi:hypothetical protein
MDVMKIAHLIQIQKPLALRCVMAIERESFQTYGAKYWKLQEGPSE